MAIRGLPRPLPECKDCGDPVRRDVHASNLGYCGGCLTSERAMAAEHQRRHLARLRADTTDAVNARVSSRIDELARKRQDREARRAAGAPR